MQNKVFIKEIFTSIQGEGPYVGVNQLFIRFSKCNLNCKYCDTDFETDLVQYDSISLAKIVNDTSNIHSVSLTGAEPLCETDFLLDFLPKINKKVYLETNGTLYENLQRLIQYIDIVSMDFKLNSAAGSGDLFIIHDKFINAAKKYDKEIFAKVVFDNNITDYEIEQCIEIAKKYDIEIILQPKTDGYKLDIHNTDIKQVFNRFINKYSKIRLIPQVHKFINVQ